jgi:hypothetical protein
MAGEEMTGMGLLPVFLWAHEVIEVGFRTFLEEVL